jgi:uncharacterized membrane protein
MWNWEFWWIFPLIMIVFCFFMMRSRGICGHGSHDTHGHGPESARGILDKRYAGGEIDKTEYEEKKRDLMGG